MAGSPGHLRTVLLALFWASVLNAPHLQESLHSRGFVLDAVACAKSLRPMRSSERSVLGYACAFGS